MERIVSLVLSIYVTIALYANLFFIQKLVVLEGADKLFWNHLAIFLLILVAVFFIVNRYISLSYTRSGLGQIRPVLLILAFTGLVLSILYHVIPLDPVFNLPSIVDQAFSSDLAFTIWLLIPLVVLFI